MMIPSNSDLKTWAASLIIDFPTDNIPILYSDDQWQKWGNIIAQETSFAANGAPGTAGFSRWMDWAMAIFLTMANF